MTRFLLAAAALAAASSVSLAAPADARRAQERIAPGIVDGAAAHALVADGVKVIDVRTPSEFAAGHVPGAINIPFDQMAQRAGELGATSSPFLLYCHSGRRSGIAVATLKSKGFTRLWDMQAFDRWAASEPKGK
jgi:phage shock protein E